MSSDLFGNDAIERRRAAPRVKVARTDGSFDANERDRGLDPSRDCPLCHSKDLWRLRGGTHVVCAQCHPPFDENRVERIRVEG